MRLRRQLERVEEYAREFAEYRRRGENLYAVERLAQLLVQSLLDLGAMIAVYTGGRKPETYRGIARYLAEVLGGFREFLEGLAGFRNILVHGYASIDRELEEEGFREIEENIFDLVERLKEYLGRVKADPPGEYTGLKKVFEKYQVKFAVLFGSRARGKRGGDYDIAVSGKFKSALELGRLLVDLADALGVHENMVDLVHFDTAPPSLIMTIVKEGVVIYGDIEETLWELSKRYLEFLDINETFRLAEGEMGTHHQ